MTAIPVGETAQPGSMPVFLMIGAASGAVRNLSSARPASGAVGGLVHPGGEHRDLLDVRRQRAEIVDALHRKQFAHLLEADIGFAARHHLADRDVRARRDDLGLELVGEAPFA